jgi:hypothetical protein
VKGGRSKVKADSSRAKSAILKDTSIIIILPEMWMEFPTMQVLSVFMAEILPELFTGNFASDRLGHSL